MNKRLKESTAAGNDRISLLPDDILLCILRVFLSPVQAAQTTALSSRWRSLWRSYPDVEFLSRRNNGGTLTSEDFRRFGAASIRKFSPDNVLLMENLNLCPVGEESSPVVEQLLDLASNRKAKEISIDYYDTFGCRLRLPLESFSVSSLKSLRLSHLDLVCNNYLGDLPSLSLHSLRFLVLNDVQVTDDRVITNLIASSPLLETLELESITKLEKIRAVYDVVNLRALTISGCSRLKEIGIVAPRLQTLNLHGIQGSALSNYLSSLSLNSLRFVRLFSAEITDDTTLTNLISSSPLLETLELEWIHKLKKIRVYDVLNLRTLKISRCDELVEIEIVAPTLQTLNLDSIYDISRIDLDVPQLNHLEVTPHENSSFGNNDIVQMVSELRLLKSLGIPGPQSEKKLKLSSPKLEKFEVWPTPGLEEIEVDGGPDLSNFILHFNNGRDARSLRKCEIRNAAANCLWELDCRMRSYRYSEASLWFLELKSFLAKFSHQFHTVTIASSYAPVIFYEEEAVQTLHTNAIRHLKIDTTGYLSEDDQNALLDSVFWASQPRYLAFVNRYFLCPRKLLHVFLSRYMEKSAMINSKKEPTKGCYNWQNRLKDVKIVGRDVLKDVKIVGRDVYKMFQKGEEEEEEETLTVLEDVAIAMFGIQGTQVCFELSWC